MTPDKLFNFPSMLLSEKAPDVKSNNCSEHTEHIHIA